MCGDGSRTEESLKLPNRSSLDCDKILRPSRRARQKRSSMAVMEIRNGYPFLLRPSSKTSQSPSFLAQSTFRVSGGAKMMEEKSTCSSNGF
jgi:hypothetical protein